MNENKAIIKKIHSAISCSQNILLLTHNNPDIDATSSVFSISYMLESMGKPHTIFFKQKPPAHLLSLDQYKHFETDERIISATKPRDLIIILDAGDFLHTGIENHLLAFKEKTVFVNIDHHETNTRFGDINLVVPNAVSTTEIIYDIFQCLEISFSEKTANHLLAGILTDTNNFTNFNTTPKSFDIASHLIRKGANISKVQKASQQKKSIQEMRTWGKIFSRLTKNNKHNIAYTIITKNDIEEHSSDPFILDGLANYLNNISDAKISLVIKEMPDDTIKISMRTNDDLLDVSKFAKMYNGGGHKKAAGFSIKGRLEKTERGWKIV